MIDTILGRRSIRGGFDAKRVPNEVIDDIVRCGLAAPSSKNAQPWRIHVVADPTVLATLADAVQDASDADRYVPIDPATGRPRQWQSTVSESAGILRAARLAIFVENRGEFSGGRGTVASADAAHLPSALVGYGLELVGVGAAIQNMWLAARELGLSGVFMGDVAIAEATIGSQLSMDGDLVGALALAYSTADPVPKSILPDRVIRHDLPAARGN